MWCAIPRTSRWPPNGFMLEKLKCVPNGFENHFLKIAMIISVVTAQFSQARL